MAALPTPLSTDTPDSTDALEALTSPLDAMAAVRASLSPSRAGDFMTCPLLYRFRVIDRLPEEPSPAAVRGTLVHRVLELLFDEPVHQRNVEQATGLVPQAWREVLESDERLKELFDADSDGSMAAEWLTGTEALLNTYFTLEDPQRLEPAEREFAVSVELASGLRLRGFIDRLDIAADGQMRVVDYKTGRSPHEAFEQRALFQMRFYALALWRLRGEVPRQLQLLYLGDGQVMRYEPDEHDLLAMERKLAALWSAIQRAHDTGDWRPRTSKLCDWCSHKALCPSWGGTPPPLPAHSDPAAVDDERPSPATSVVDV